MCVRACAHPSQSLVSPRGAHGSHDTRDTAGQVNCPDKALEGGKEGTNPAPTGEMLLVHSKGEHSEHTKLIERHFAKIFSMFKKFFSEPLHR